MLKKEFLELTHKTDEEVSDIDYSRIDALYNELNDMDKQEFCRLLIDDLPNLLSVAAKTIRDLKEENLTLLSDKHKLTESLLANSDYKSLLRVYSRKDVIIMKINEDDEVLLDDDDIDYIRKNLK